MSNTNLIISHQRNGPTSRVPLGAIIFMFYRIVTKVIWNHLFKDRGYLRDGNDIRLDFHTDLVLSFEEYSRKRTSQLLDEANVRVVCF